MKEFKNLIGQVEFKLLYENNKIENKNLFDGLLNESENGNHMNFGNRTGFGESLIGRAINKIFSFGKTKIMYQYLKTYQDEVEDVYLRAILATFSVMKIEVVNEKEVEAQAQEEPQTQEEPQNQTIGSGSKYEMVLYNGLTTELSKALTNNNNKEKFKVSLKSYGFNDETITEVLKYVEDIQKLQKDKNNNKQSTPRQSKDSFIMQKLKKLGYEKKTINVKKFEDDGDLNTTVNNQIIFMSNVLNTIEGESLSKKNIGMLSKIKDNIEKEKNNLSDDNKNKLSNIQSSIDNIIDGKEKIEISDDEYTKNIKSENDLSIDEMVSIITEVFQYYFKIGEQEKKKSLEKCGGDKEDERYIKTSKTWKKITKSIHPDKVAHFTKKEEFIDFLVTAQNLFIEAGVYESYRQINIDLELIKEVFQYGYIREDSQEQTKNNNEQTSNKETNPIDEKIKSLKNDIVIAFKKDKDGNNKIKEKIKSIKLSNIGNINSDKDAVKKAIRDLNDISYTDIDPAKKLLELKNSGDKEQLISFYKIVIDNVNKEALKVIALKAEMLYNRETYKDARSEIYSRVNFTITDPDKMKLEQSWKKKISEVKSIYMPFFSSTGSFPQDLDPIALIESDKTMRTTFAEYGDDARNILKDNSSNNVGGVVSPQLEKLQLSQKKINNMNYVFDVVDSNDIKFTYSLFFQAVNKISDSEKYNINLYLFKGLILLDDLIKIEKMKEENLNNLKDSEIKNLIDKYSITKESDVDSFSNSLDDKWIKEKIERYKNYLNKMVKFTNNKTLFLYNSQMITKGPKNMILLSDENNELKMVVNNINVDFNEDGSKYNVEKIIIKNAYYVKENNYWNKLNNIYSDFGKTMKTLFDNNKQKLISLWNNIQNKQKK